MLVGVTDWNGIVSPSLDAASSLALYEAGAAGAEPRGRVALGELFPPLRAAEVAASGVEVLICGAVSNALAAALSARGITLVPFVSGPVEEVVRAYVAGTLWAPRFALPGCRRWRHRWGRGGPRGPAGPW